MAEEARLLVRVEATQARMEKQMAAIAKSAARQAKASEDSFRSANDNIGKGFQRSEKQVVQSLGAQRAAVSNLSFQLNDIAQGLASGTSPFTIMVQQGSQVSQVLQGSGGLVGAVKTLGGAFTQMLNPVSLASFALIGVAGLATQYFTDLLSSGEDSEESLKKQADLIQKVADRWGDALPALKAYADEVKRAADLGDAQAATDASVKAQYAGLRGVLNNLQTEIAGVTLAMENVGGAAAGPQINALQSAFDNLRKKASDNTAGVEDLSKVVSQLMDFFRTNGKTDTLKLAAAFGALAEQIQTAQENAANLRAELALQRLAQDVPLGALTPLTSGGGQFLNPEQLQKFSANESLYKEAGESAAAAMIRGFESFSEKAYPDSRTSTGKFDAYRAGFGSDTTTRANGNIEKVTKDTVVTLEDAQRDLSRRLVEFQTGIQKAIGVDTWRSLSEAQQAALSSIAYNYGSLPKSIVAAIQSGGGPEAVAKAIASLTANPTRRKEEAQSYLNGTGISLKEAGIGAGETKKTPDDIFKGNIAQVQKRIDILNAEFEAQAKLNPLVEDYGYAVEKAKIEAQLLADAQKAGVEITPTLATDISRLAENYAKASVASKQLNDQQQKTAQTLAESSAFGKNVLGGFISDLKAGKSASEALANALNKVADKLLEVSLNALFDGMGKSGGGGGFLGGIFGSLGKLLGFASGGYTGPGGKNQPAGVVHKGEYVFDKRSTDRIGVKNLGKIQKGYAAGGLVGAMTPRIAAPSVPQTNPIAQGGIAGVRVFVDQDGNWQAKVMEISRREAAGVTRNGLNQYDKQLDRSFGSKMARAQTRQM